MMLSDDRTSAQTLKYLRECIEKASSHALNSSHFISVIDYPNDVFVT